MLRRAIKKIKDFLFPIFCVVCNTEGVWLCPVCRQKNSIKPFVFYPFTINAEFNKIPVAAFFSYTSNFVGNNLISAWKYGGAQEINAEWRTLISSAQFFVRQYIENNFDTRQIISLLPVPLHPRRERERGFNQARILADLLFFYFQSWGWRTEIITGLKRVYTTVQQAKLSLEARQINLSNAFSWNKDTNIPHQIILVDDVFTTGATTEACARVLRAQQAQKIGIIVLAHG